MPKGVQARIKGLGSYLPKRVLTNQDLEQIVDTSDEWIVSRTGIKERRIAAEDEASSDMGFYAAQRALEACQMEPSKIDLILVATMTPDYLTPSTAAIIQSKLGATHAAACDIQAACTGFIYGLSIAKAYVESGIYNNILLIATEKMTSFVDYSDRNTCVLFGDGASSAIIGKEGSGLLINTVCLGADGHLSQLLSVPAGGSRYPTNQETLDSRKHYLNMAGKEVFKHAVRRMTLAGQECMDKAGIRNDQIAWIIPHQANLRIIDAVAKSFSMPENKVFKTVHKYGNTSASSVSIALDELLQEHAINEGEHLLLVAFGAGLTWGAAILCSQH